MDHTSQTAVFNPDAIASINRAYLEALRAVGGPAAPVDVRAKLAEHMMSLARNGETDEGRLCSQSVVAVLGRPPGHRRRPQGGDQAGEG